MSFLWSMIRWELRFQFASLRTRVAAFVYIAACLGTPIYVMTHSLSEKTRFVAHLLETQPFFTICLAMLVAGHRSGGDTWPETRLALTSARVSNFSFLLGRSIAHMVLLSLVALIPFLVTLGFAALTGWQGYDLSGWISAWALRILPLVMVSCAAWLAAVTILGRELAALGAVVLGSYLFMLALNQVLFLFRWHIEIGSLTDWLGLVDLGLWFEILTGSLSFGGHPTRYFPLTEAPFDVDLAIQEMLPRATTILGLAFFLLCVSTAYVRRGRRDVRPYRTRPDHPLRTYLLLLFRLREHLTPAAGLGRTDRSMVLLGGVMLCACLGLGLTRQSHFQRLADERYQAETEVMPPMPAHMVPLDWRFAGTVTAQGNVRVEGRGSLRHQGDEAAHHLAFSLNEHLALEELHVPDRKTTVSRAWDRVRVDLDPPLRPGETLELHSRISGVPGKLHFPLAYRGRTSFVANLSSFRTAALPQNMVDFSLTRFERAASPERFELLASDLGLVPRFTSWELTPFTNQGGEGGQQVPQEKIFHQVDLEVHLDFPQPWFVADPCGNTSHSNASGGVLMAGECRVVLTEYGIFGGRLQVLSDDLVTFAALPSNIEAAAHFRQSMAGVAQLTARAWPGLSGVSGLVALDWPRQVQFDAMAFGFYELHGQLILIPENDLSRGFVRRPEQLVSQLLMQKLLDRRPVDLHQGVFFRRLLQVLLLQRMDLARQKSAVVSIKGSNLAALQKPILTAEPHHATLWYQRLSAVLRDLTARIGTPAMTQGIETFLSAGPQPGNFDQLMATLESASGTSLQRFADDFIRGTATPLLQLHDVESQRDGDGFRVNGSLRNVGTGEVFCPVVVKTDINQAQTLVRVDSESTTPFEVRTTSKPLLLQLDPNGTCHRVHTSPLAATQELVNLESSS